MCDLSLRNNADNVKLDEEPGEDAVVSSGKNGQE